MTALQYFIAWFLLPDMVTDLLDAIDAVNIEIGFEGVWNMIGKMLAIIFSHIRNCKWWVRVVVGMLLCTNMALSGADIRCSIDGVLILLPILLAANFVLGLIGTEILHTFTNAVVSFGIQIAMFMLLSLATSAIMVLLSFLIRIIFKK